MKLHHPHTPSSLESINKDITLCLDAPKVDETHLKILIDQRANLVDKLLNSMSKEQRQQFAQAEVTINQALIEHVTELRDETKKALSSVAKSSRAIKQYQQV